MIYPLPDYIKIPFLSLKDVQHKLRNSSPDFAFTLDGKLIGDIGEALVKHYCQILKKVDGGSKLPV